MLSPTWTARQEEEWTKRCGTWCDHFDSRIFRVMSRFMRDRLAPIDLFEEVCEQKQLAIRHRGVAEKPYVEQVPGDFQCLSKRFAAIDEDRFAKQLLLCRFGHDRQRLSRVLHLLHSGSLEPLHGRVSGSLGRTVQAPRER